MIHQAKSRIAYAYTVGSIGCFILRSPGVRGPRNAGAGIRQIFLAGLRNRTTEMLAGTHLIRPRQAHTVKAHARVRVATDVGYEYVCTSTIQPRTALTVLVLYSYTSYEYCTRIALYCTSTDTVIVPRHVGSTAKALVTEEGGRAVCVTL